MTLILAGVTFLLACAAFGSIWQNHLINRRERKERLLNEIIEWGKDLEYSVLSSHEISLTKELREDLDMARKGLVDVWLGQRDLERRLSVLNRLEREVKEGDRYVEKLAARLDEGLGVTVREVLNLMKTRVELLANEQEHDVEGIKRDAELLMQFMTDETKSLESTNLSESGRNTVLLMRNAGDIRKSVNKLIGEAIKIKTKGID